MKLTRAYGFPAVAALMLLFLAAPLMAIDINVPADFPTIQGAIDAAIDGDVVIIADGIYTGPGNVNMSFGGKLITVRSASGDPATCVIDCESTAETRGFNFSGGETPDSIVDGLTFRNGLMAGAIPLERGAGMHIAFGSSPTVRNCVFENNSAVYGSAVLVFDSSPLFEGCVFRNNGDASTIAGGAFENLTATSMLLRCTFTGNTASAGGGVASEVDGVLTVSSCTFSGNTSPFGAGAYSAFGSDVELHVEVFQLVAQCVLRLALNGIQKTFNELS